MWRSHRENKPVDISYFLFYPSSTICIFSPLPSTIFIYSFSIAYLLIASLHLIKSKKLKEINKTLEKMKGICFTFDAFGQWSEHERNKIWWRMKAGVEWRSSVATQPMIYDWPSTFPLFPLLYLLLSSSLSQPPHLGDKLESFWPHGLAARPHLGFPVKGLPRGPRPSSHKLTSIAKLSESFSMFLLSQF
jgi:hypothetical protein